MSGLREMKKSLSGIDMVGVSNMFKSFDKNFVTLSTNQVFMQENQVEFEQYLKAIIKNQKKIMAKLEIIE